MGKEVSDREVKLLVSKLIRVGILERVDRENVKFSKAFIDDVMAKTVMIIRDRTALGMLASECRSIDELCEDVTLTAIAVTLMEWLCTTSIEKIMPIAQVLLNIMKHIQKESAKREAYFI